MPNALSKKPSMRIFARNITMNYWSIFKQENLLMICAGKRSKNFKIRILKNNTTIDLINLKYCLTKACVIMRIKS